MEKNDHSLIDMVLKKAGDASFEKENYFDLNQITSAVLKTADEAARRLLDVSFSIVDQAGNLYYFYRMPNAILVSLTLSQKKAYTAVAMNESTINLYSKCQPGEPLFQLETFSEGKIVTFGGGIPIRINNCLVGGLGVSGAPDPKEDDSLAKYWLKHLEFEDH
ncbi:GlcG/HbpS family heme-binding protein [Liquorilactobacillus ghanensis]|uniref:GlcG/HbpS family heme-binding protein n=1 Tax=Liquorilactobacillus ghanensis TaxID=399370 RepID=UPI0039E7417C